MDPGRSGDGRFQQGPGDFIRRNRVVMAGQYRPQGMKHADGARLPCTVWLAWPEDARRPNQSERGEAAGNQPLFYLAFDSPVKGARLWVGADRGVESKALRAVLVQQSGHGER